MLFAVACADPDMDTCCECLINTAPDGSASTDGSANCWADTGDGDIDAETEGCANTSQAIAIAGAAFDNGVTVSLLADGCRQSCFDACSAVDDTVKFETPEVSAGTFSVTTDGTTTDASFVLASIGPGLDAGTSLVQIRATTDAGDWNLTLATLDGPGQYTIAPQSNFEVRNPTDNAPAGGGTFDVSFFDGVTLDMTFSVDFTATSTGTVSVDFTVNDGDTSGWIGLDANEGE